MGSKPHRGSSDPVSLHLAWVGWGPSSLSLRILLSKKLHWELSPPTGALLRGSLLLGHTPVSLLPAWKCP